MLLGELAAFVEREHSTDQLVKFSRNEEPDVGRREVALTIGMNAAIGTGSTMTEAAATAVFLDRMAALGARDELAM